MYRRLVNPTSRRRVAIDKNRFAATPRRKKKKNGILSDRISFPAVISEIPVASAKRRFLGLRGAEHFINRFRGSPDVRGSRTDFRSYRSAHGFRGLLRPNLTARLRIANDNFSEKKYKKYYQSRTFETLSWTPGVAHSYV